jgi:hypothetical protein
MKIIDEDLLLKYDVKIDKTFHIDGTISCLVEAQRDTIDEILELFLGRNKFNYEITHIKSKKKNYVKYNIVFKNKENNQNNINNDTKENY